MPHRPSPQQRLANARRRADQFLEHQPEKVWHAFADLLHKLLDDAIAERRKQEKENEQPKRGTGLHVHTSGPQRWTHKDDPEGE